MSDIRFHCAICGAGLTVTPDFAGGVVECRACQRHVPVPALVHEAGGSAGCAPLFPVDVLAIEVKFRCPGCLAKLRVDVRWEGHQFPCPHCGTAAHVPQWSRTRPAATGRLSAAEIEFLSAPEPKLAG